MVKHLWLEVATLGWIACAWATAASASDCESLGGGMLGPANVPTSTLAVEVFSCPAEQRIALQQIAARSADGTPSWKTLDLVRVASAAAAEEIVFSACSRGGTRAPDLLAFGLRDAPHHLEVRRVWEVDRSLGRLREIDPAGVSCEPLFAYGHEEEWQDLREPTSK